MFETINIGRKVNLYMKFKHSPDCEHRGSLFVSHIKEGNFLGSTLGSGSKVSQKGLGLWLEGEDLIAQSRITQHGEWSGVNLDSNPCS